MLFNSFSQIRGEADIKTIIFQAFQNIDVVEHKAKRNKFSFKENLNVSAAFKFFSQKNLLRDGGGGTRTHRRFFTPSEISNLLPNQLGDSSHIIYFLNFVENSSKIPVISSNR